MDSNTIYHGLNYRASHFLEIIPQSGNSVYNHVYSKNGKAFPLRKYTLKSGDVLTEAVQCQPWTNCSEHIFIALKDCNNEWLIETPWMDMEIEKIISK